MESHVSAERSRVDRSWVQKREITELKKRSIGQRQTNLQGKERRGEERLR